MTILAYWEDEIAQWQDVLARYVPEPKRGGTWLYCPRAEPHPVGRLCWYRTKRPKAYRRHWRRHHQ